MTKGGRVFGEENYEVHISEASPAPSTHLGPGRPTTASSAKNSDLVMELANFGTGPFPQFSRGASKVLRALRGGAML